MSENSWEFAPSDSPAPGTFEAIYAALEASSLAVIGPARPRLLVIPIRDANGSVVGGLWGYTSFEWLHVQMLFVPEPLRRMGVGAALMASAEAEARERGCRGAYVDTFSFQAAPFYRGLGFTQFGKLDDCPPGHDRLYFGKRFDAAPVLTRSVACQRDSRAFERDPRAYRHPRESGDPCGLGPRFRGDDEEPRREEERRRDGERGEAGKLPARNADRSERRATAPGAVAAVPVSHQ